jgi:hypothetical protein
MQNPRNVAGMVRGLRDNPNNPDFMSLILAEIKKELESCQPAKIKTNAFLKLGYLSMLGIDMSIAHLAIIEVMSSPQFALKRPAMFIASLAFKSNPDITLLTTNIFLKELVSPRYLEIGMALSCLSSIISEDIAGGVISGILPLTSHSKAYVRKKAALSMFKITEKCPNLFPDIFPKLKDLLADPDQSVQSASVCSFLEIARRNPKLLIPLIPVFFHLLKEIKNNWLLIKLLKIIEHLTRVENRLWTKLIASGVLKNLLESVSAKSVQIELTRFIVKLCDFEDEASISSIEMAITLLKDFINSTDLNIQYLGIRMAGDLLERSPTTTIPMQVLMGSIDAEDSSIRRASLRACGFIVKTNDEATHFIQQLLAAYAKNESKQTIKSDISNAILSVPFQLIKDTEWYLRILLLLGDSATRFREVCQDREPEVVLRLAIAAVTKGDLSLDMMTAACWATGKHCYGQKCTLDTQKVGAVLNRMFEVASRQDISVENQIELIWSGLKLVMASRLTGSGQYEEILDRYRCGLNELLEKTSTVPIPEVCGIAFGILNQADDDTMVKILFDDDPQLDIPVPEDMDQPLIALPPNLIFDPAVLSSNCHDEAYTDTEDNVPDTSSILIR